jgi:hypothetical protein
MRWVSKIMAKVDPRDFYLNTDYEMDKIIYYKETKLTPNQYGNVVLQHTLGLAPLITGVWAKTADFSEPHPFSGVSGVVDPSSNSYVNDVVAVNADENEILFTQFTGSISGGGRYPFYVRIMGFEPSGSHKDLGKTSQNASVFILNTDYNYLKLYKAGSEDVVWNSQTGLFDPITITHNLGYHPQALFWIESVGTDYRETLPLTHVSLPNIYTDKACVESYTDKFIVRPPLVSGSSNKIQYRIYYDEA